MLERVDSEVINEFLKLLESDGKYIVLVPHANADGDAIGSVLGLWRVLKNAGYHVRVVSPTKYPAFYHWMEGHNEVIIYSHQHKTAAKVLEEASLLICMDFNTESRVGDMQPLIDNFTQKKVLIDHHPEPGDFADLVISDITSSSTCELVFSILNSMSFNKYIDKDAATSLFTGLMTDTGSFDFNVSDPRTFETAAELLKLGANQEKIHAAVYDNYSADRFKLLGFCLSNRMKVYPEYGAACLCLTLKDQKRFNFVPGDSEGFVNIPLSIEGIVFSILLVEKENYIKASLRSKGSFPANKFSAEYFNGGGHLNAAGGELYASLRKALFTFEQGLSLYKNELLEALKG